MRRKEFRNREKEPDHKRRRVEIAEGSPEEQGEEPPKQTVEKRNMNVKDEGPKKKQIKPIP